MRDAGCTLLRALVLFGWCSVAVGTGSVCSCSCDVEVCVVPDDLVASNRSQDAGTACTASVTLIDGVLTENIYIGSCNDTAAKRSALSTVIFRDSVVNVKGSVTIVGTWGVTNVSAPRLNKTRGLLLENLHAMSSFDFTGLQEVDGKLYVRSNAKLVDASFESLLLAGDSQTTETFFINNAALQRISLPLLQDARSPFHVRNNGELISISAPSLARIWRLKIETNNKLSEAYFPALTNFTDPAQFVVTIAKGSGSDLNLTLPAEELEDWSTNPSNSSTFVLKVTNIIRASVCAENEYVSSHVCTACAKGTTNSKGNDESGSDTTCDFPSPPPSPPPEPEPAPAVSACNVDNGGCHGLVTCSDDGRGSALCGICPSGYTGDGVVSGTGCEDVNECVDTSLVNGGCSKLVTCSNVVGGRTCGACPVGYEGDGTTCVDLDECATANGGCDLLTKCANIAGGRTCGSCPSGYKGSGVTGCVLESACATNNGGCDFLTECTDLSPGVSTCGACPTGYDGDGTNGCVDRDACVASPCAVGVHCEDAPAPSLTRTCGACPPGQVGDGETCSTNPCFIKNGGCDALVKCSASSGGGLATCGSCPAGYARDDPSDQFSTCVDVDGCASSPCHTGVLCTDVPTPGEGFTCSTCPSGYSGDGETCVDIDECSTANGGCDVLTTCVNTNGGFTCGACPSGYKGSGKTGCARISACATNNGGCDVLTTCADDGNGGTVCGACPSGGGYSGDGDSGCVDIDGCANDPCYPGVSCVDTPAGDGTGTGHTCDACPEGFSGDGTSCTLCTMGVYIAASTVVNGAVPRGRNTKIIAGSELMDPVCTNENGYVFKWSAQRSDGTDVTLDTAITKADTPTLFLPRRSLPPGISYTLRFEGRQFSNSRVSASVEFDFYVHAAALEAIVDGGECLVTEGVPISLDASQSVDPDQEIEYAWDYSWLCEAIAPTMGDCLQIDGTKLALPRTSQAVLSDLNLKGDASSDGQTYAFTLTARKGARRSSVTTTVAVVAAAAGATGVPPGVSIPPLPGQGAVNSGDLARVTSVVVTEDLQSLALRWSATRTADAGGSAEAVDLLQNNFLASSSVNTKYLVLARNALQRGYAYRFRLDASDANGAAAAFLTLSENLPPANGTVTASPSSGTALSTAFTLTASGWEDAHLPLSYRFTVRVVGADTGMPLTQLQDFGPLSTFRGTLPGGLDSSAGAVVVAVTVRDALGATTQAQEVTIKSTWPTLATEEAATEATSLAVKSAQALIKAGGAESAMNVVRSACEQLENFKARQTVSRRRKLTQYDADSIMCDTSDNATTALRQSERESMVAVTVAARNAVPSSATLFSSVAGVAARVLSDPCETTNTSRTEVVSLIAGMFIEINETHTPTFTTTSDSGTYLDDDGSVNMLDALSAAVTPRRYIGSGDLFVDEDAEASSSAAAAVTRALVATRLAPALPDELPVFGTTSMLSYSAGRYTSGANATSATAGSANFTVPESAMSLSNDDPVDVELISFAFDPRGFDAGVNRAANALGAVPIAAAPRVSNLVSLNLRNVTSGDELMVQNLSIPIQFTLPLRVELTETPSCDALRDTSVSPSTQIDRVACTFWDEQAGEFSLTGCVNLPNPRPDGSAFTWNQSLFDLIGDDTTSESFLWHVTLPSLLDGCVESVATDPNTNETLRTWANGDASACELTNPGNAQQCYWRVDTQAFEGCGCVFDTSVACLCNHATDFAASASKPSPRVLTFGELSSVTFTEIAESWKVFAVLSGMFGGTAIIAIAMFSRDQMRCKELLRDFIDTERQKTSFGFAVVRGVWTWSIDARDIQSVFAKQHLANDDPVVLKLLREEVIAVGGDPDDAKQIKSAFERMCSVTKDPAVPAVERAVERRRAAIKRQAYSKANLSFKLSSGDLEGLSARDRESCELADKMAAESDVGIVVKQKPDGKTIFGVERLTSNVVADDLRGLTEDDVSSPRLLGKSQKSKALPKSRTVGREDITFDSDSDDSDDVESVGVSAKIHSAKFKELTSYKKRRSSVSRQKYENFVPPPRLKHVQHLPEPKGNAFAFCEVCGISYVRFMLAFPAEALHRDLVFWKHDSRTKSAHTESSRSSSNDAPVFLTFDRALGTAMTYAFLDGNNVVSKTEMSRRIFEAAQLPWLMPTGLTFPLLVTEFKVMFAGNLTRQGWLKRCSLWNVVALQQRDGSWNGTDALAGALRAAGPPRLAAAVVKTKTSARLSGSNDSVEDLDLKKLSVHRYYDAEVALNACPDELCALTKSDPSNRSLDSEPKLNWRAVERIWCTLLAMRGCSHYGLTWVLNPWDDEFAEYDINQRGWAYLAKKVGDDQAIAHAVMSADAAADRAVGTWRVEHEDAMHALRDLTLKREIELKKRPRSFDRKQPLRYRCLGFFSSTVCVLAHPVTAARRFTKSAWVCTKWVTHTYAKAHMLFRSFLAKPTDSFTGGEQFVTQSTIYVTSLLVTIWFFYSRATTCCVLLRRDLGCSDDPLEACGDIPENAGCALLMSPNVNSVIPEDWRCTAFPDTEDVTHFVIVVVIQLAVMFPVRFTLTRGFTAGGGTVMEPHWRQAVVAAGMSSIEIIVAWLETFFQLLTDPEQALLKPEVGEMVNGAGGAIRKTLTTCGMHYLLNFWMFILGACFWSLDKCGVYKRKPTETKYDSVHLIKERLAAIAEGRVTDVLVVGDDLYYDPTDEESSAYTRNNSRKGLHKSPSFLRASEVAVGIPFDEGKSGSKPNRTWNAFRKSVSSKRPDLLTMDPTKPHVNNPFRNGNARLGSNSSGVWRKQNSSDANASMNNGASMRSLASQKSNSKFYDPVTSLKHLTSNKSLTHLTSKNSRDHTTTLSGVGRPYTRSISAAVHGVRKISLDEIEYARVAYEKRLAWSSTLFENSTWFLVAFLWVFGGYVIIVYGALIYRYMGAGEETAYIIAWGTAFAVNNFGLESVKIIARKAFFMVFVEYVGKRLGSTKRECLFWYETYTELAGTHLLVDTNGAGAISEEAVGDAVDASEEVEATDMLGE